MGNRKRRLLGRRALLRGAGTVAIGLPFLDALSTEPAAAAEPEPPARAFTVFFGLGIPKEIQARGFDGPLEPLRPLADKLALVRGVNLYEADGSANNHFDGGGGIFVGTEPKGEAEAGGPSIDQVILEAKYPDGLPEGLVPTLLAGSFFRRSRLTRYVHSWAQDGSPVALPKETPADVFTRIFGSATPEEVPTDPDTLKAQHYDRSVLDAVVDQYRHYQSDASNLGTNSRARIADHLDRVREHERRIFGDERMLPAGCGLPDAPGTLPLLGDQAPDPDGQGVDVTLDDWVAVWRTMVDVYALGVKCDLVRFGSVLFQSAGERVRLTGDYGYDGRMLYQFDDVRDRGGRSGSDACSHEFWHAYRKDGDNPELEMHTHFLMREVAYFLSALDDPAYADENGGTILDNAMVMVGTELGDGNPHNLESVFHAVGGANGRFRTGQILDAEAEALDLYNTVLQGYGIDRTMGPSDRAVKVLPGLLA